MARITAIRVTKGQGWKSVEEPALALSEIFAHPVWYVEIRLADGGVISIQNLNFSQPGVPEAWSFAIAKIEHVVLFQPVKTVRVKKGRAWSQVGGLAEAFAYYSQAVELWMGATFYVTFINELFGQPGCPTSWSCAFAPASELIPETVAI